MRRYIALTFAFAVLTAALGCQHIGGKCDCGYNPSDYPIPPLSPAHPSIPAPAVKPTPPPGGGNE